MIPTKFLQILCFFYISKLSYSYIFDEWLINTTKLTKSDILTLGYFGLDVVKVKFKIKTN